MNGDEERWDRVCFAAMGAERVRELHRERIREPQEQPNRGRK